MVPRGTAAQDIVVPVQSQLKILQKVLEFDRALEARSGETLTIGVVYQPGNRSSIAAANEVVTAGREVETQLAGYPVKYVRVPVTSSGSVSQAVDVTRLDVLYVMPLRAFSLEKIVEISREASIRTIAVSPEQLAGGLTLALDMKDGRPKIVLNLPAARAEGADFSSQLLRLAQVVGDDG